MTKKAIATLVGGVVLFALGVAATFGVIGDSDSGGSVSTSPAMTMPGGETMPTEDMDTTGAQTTTEMPGMEMP